jgi:hypothetical protein
LPIAYGVAFFAISFSAAGVPRLTFSRFTSLETAVFLAPSAAVARAPAWSTSLAVA